MLSIQYSLRLSSSASNPIKASFSSKPNKVPTLGIRIAPELEKIGFKRNIVYQLSVAVTPPWLLRHPVTDFTLHSLDKAVAVPEVFKVRFYELCDCVKTFYHIYTNGSKMGHRVLAAFYHSLLLFGCLVQQSSSMWNFTIYCLRWTLSEDLKKEKHIILLSDTYSSLIALGGSR